jgi:uncharacterized protein involved in exopolysaccharide biosynthesis
MMSELQSDYSHADDEIDLRELFQVVWEGKALIAIVTGLAAIISVVVALSLPNIYQSSAILAPKSGDGTGGLSRLASQYGGIASLAGINLGGLGGDGMSKPAVAIEKMKSLSFFKKHLYEDLLVDLMAVESWDPSTRQLMYDVEIYDIAAKKWLREVGPPRQAQPSDQEAHKAFLELLSVSEDKKTGLISVSVQHQSPDIAKRWVELMVSRVSEDLRSTDILEAEESIKFLEAQREKTSLVSLDEIFAQLIEEQTKTIMLANVAKDYVFDVIDPPVAPELKSKPSRALICVLGTLLGGMLGVVVVLIRYYGRQDPH